jgi:hypothetical protein
MKNVSLCLLMVAIYLLVSPMSAQVWIPSGTETRRPSALQFDSGASSYRGDYFAYLSPNFTYNHGSKFGYSFSLPVNIMTLDRDPVVDGSKPGKIRDIDYNSKADYFRVLNYLSYGTYNQQVPGQITYSVYAGKVIDGYIGHGTIVNKYQSSSRFDSYNPSVMADMNSDYAGVQYFSNSVSNFDVNAARVYIKPLAIGRKIYSMFENSTGMIYMMNIRGNVLDDAGRKSVEEELGADGKPGEKKTKEIRSINKDSRMELVDNDPWYNRLTLGYTNAWDKSAPTQISYNSNGAPVTAANLDNPKTKDATRVSIEGFDMEYRLLNLPFVEFTPYLDFNRIKTLDNSTGTHYGSILRVGTKDLNIIFKPELRQMTGNYAPIYFDSFYEIERFQSFPTGSAPMRTKYEQLQGASNATVRGYYHTLYVNFYHIGFEFAIEDYGGKDKQRVFAAAYIPLGSSFKLSFFYTKKGYDGQGKAFQIDENAQGAAEISKSFGPLMVRFQNYRRFYLDSDQKTFVSTDELRLLVSGGISF